MYLGDFLNSMDYLIENYSSSSVLRISNLKRSIVYVNQVTQTIDFDLDVFDDISTRYYNYRYIILPIVIQHHNGSHLTTLMIDNVLKTIEYFELDNDTYLLSIPALIRDNLLNIYTPNANMYSITHFGHTSFIRYNNYVQRVQYTANPNGGYCVGWGLYMIHLRLMNSAFMSIDFNRVALDYLFSLSPEALTLKIQQYITFMIMISHKQIRNEEFFGYFSKNGYFSLPYELNGLVNSEGYFILD